MKTLPWILVCILLSLIIFMRLGNGCGASKRTIVDTIYKRDTLWETHDSVITRKMVVKEVIHDSIPVIYNAHPDYDSLKLQYEALVSKYTLKNIYHDSYKLGDYGYIHVSDTVQYNTLGHRSYKEDYKLPTIIDSVIIRELLPEKPALFYGGGLNVSKSGLNQVQLGLMYKNKNKLTGVYLGVTPAFKLSAGVQLYWKLTK